MDRFHSTAALVASGLCGARIIFAACAAANTAQVQK
jgi:hypothetical protein